MSSANHRSSNRRGGVYLAVLGTALIASVLAFSALGLQRIHHRQLSAAVYIRQAQLNSHAATELGLLSIQQNANWRNSRDAQSYLFVGRSLGDYATCSLRATDAATEAADAADRPITLLGVGQQAASPSQFSHLTADQRVELTIDPRREAHDSLKPGTTALPTEWQAIVNYYSNPANAMQIQLTSLPTRTRSNGATLEDQSFGMNVSVTNTSTYWYDARTLAPDDFAAASVDRQTNIPNSSGHAHCLRVQRSNRRAGPANRLQAHFLKPNTQYRVDIELYVPFVLFVNGNWFQSYLICRTGSSYSIVAGSSQSVTASQTNSWVTRTFTITTPSWTPSTRPQEIYFAINSEPSGNNGDFYVDNIDFYETDARFIYQTVVGTMAQNPRGLYWIDCQNSTKLVIERSRIFGTLLVLNPGPGSCIDYGPIHMSPASPGYPTLLVSNTNGNAFSIRPTPSSVPATDGLRESENGITYNPTGAPHKTHGIDGDLSDDYDSEIRGLVIVSGNLTTANDPAIQGKVIVGGSGLPTYTYQPDSLINPPPPLGAFYNYRYDPRTTSVRKVVLP